jgi:hypothetical protein
MTTSGKSLLRMRHFPEIAKRDSVQHHMRREAGAVRGYGRRLFTQAHARRLAAQDPTANDRIFFRPIAAGATIPVARNLRRHIHR